MVQRVTYRRQGCYNTRSNRVRIVKTPGNTLRYQHLKKLGSSPKCGDCGIALPGIPALRPREYANISKPKKTVQRAYGGSRCANCVHDRVIRAFLIEEQQVSSSPPTDILDLSVSLLVIIQSELAQTKNTLSVMIQCTE